MTPREVTHLRHRLRAIAAAADELSRQAEDLHAVAYDRPAFDGVKVAGGSGGGVEDVGDDRARHLWRRLEKALEPMELNVRALSWAVANLLSRGGGIEETRGSLIARRELTDALSRQRRRHEQGEYSPARMADQPEYPGGGA